MLKLLDESCGQTRQGYTLTRIYLIGGDRVKVGIKRDAYEFQSWAAASVLTVDRTWNPLLDDPASNWHSSTPVETSDVHAVLGTLAEKLAGRAAVVLDASG